MIAHVQEFANLLTANGTTNYRLQTIAEVGERQTGVRRRQQLADGAMLLADGDVRAGEAESFTKVEQYPEPKDPRTITILGNAAKTGLSMLGGALSTLLKQEDVLWYAFGLNPKDVAARVAEVATGCELHQAMHPTFTLYETDFSRFDGTIGPVQRLCTLVCARSAMSQEVKHLVADWVELCFGNTVRTTSDRAKKVLYDQGYARASGDPLTAVCNSLDNAFSAFYSHRRHGLSPRDAWGLLGIYGGDDGLTFAGPHYESHCAELGLRIKAKKLKQGDLVTFLARVYGPGVWQGDDDSIVEISRCLRQFPFTTMPIHCDNGLVARAKAISIIYSDSNTPVIGELCRKIIKQTNHYVLPLAVPGSEAARTFEEALATNWTYTVARDSGSSYPNVVSQWAQEYVATVFLHQDTDALNAWLADAGAPYTSPPQLTPSPEYAPSDKSMLINGEYLEGVVDPSPPKLSPMAPEAKVAIRALAPDQVYVSRGSGVSADGVTRICRICEKGFVLTAADITAFSKPTREGTPMVLPVKCAPCRAQAKLDREAGKAPIRAPYKGTNSDASAKSGDDPSGLAPAVGNQVAPGIGRGKSIADCPSVKPGATAKPAAKNVVPQSAKGKSAIKPAPSQGANDQATTRAFTFNKPSQPITSAPPQDTYRVGAASGYARNDDPIPAAGSTANLVAASPATTSGAVSPAPSWAAALMPKSTGFIFGARGPSSTIETSKPDVSTTQSINAHAKDGDGPVVHGCGRADPRTVYAPPEGQEPVEDDAWTTDLSAAIDYAHDTDEHHAELDRRRGGSVPHSPSGSPPTRSEASSEDSGELCVPMDEDSSAIEEIPMRLRNPGKKGNEDVGRATSPYGEVGIFELARNMLPPVMIRRQEILGSFMGPERWPSGQPLTGLSPPSEDGGLL